MKKILLFFFITGFSSCLPEEKSYETFEVTYSVCYPDKTVTETINVPDTSYLSSYRGSNRLMVRRANKVFDKVIIETTALVRIDNLIKLKNE